MDILNLLSLSGGGLTAFVLFGALGAALMVFIAGAALGAGAVTTEAVSMASDDVSLFLRERPGCFFFVGAALFENSAQPGPLVAGARLRQASRLAGSTLAQGLAGLTPDATEPAAAAGAAAGALASSAAKADVAIRPANRVASSLFMYFP